MRITLTAPISRNRIKEGSTFTLTAKFYDDASDPWTLSAPTTIRYRVDAGTYQIRTWTTVSAASSVSIVLDSTDNAIIGQGNQCEPRQITVQADSELSTQYAETFSWDVINVAGIY